MRVCIIILHTLSHPLGSHCVMHAAPTHRLDFNANTGTVQNSWYMRAPARTRCSHARTHSHTHARTHTHTHGERERERETHIINTHASIQNFLRPLPRSCTPLAHVSTPKTASARRSLNLLDAAASFRHSPRRLFRLFGSGRRVAALCEKRVRAGDGGMCKRRAQTVRHTSSGLWSAHSISCHRFRYRRITDSAPIFRHIGARTAASQHMVTSLAPLTGLSAHPLAFSLSHASTQAIQKQTKY